MCTSFCFGIDSIQIESFNLNLQRQKKALLSNHNEQSHQETQKEEKNETIENIDMVQKINFNEIKYNSYLSRV